MSFPPWSSSQGATASVRVEQHSFNQQLQNYFCTAVFLLLKLFADSFHRLYEGVYERAGSGQFDLCRCRTSSNRLAAPSRSIMPWQQAKGSRRLEKLSWPFISFLWTLSAVSAKTPACSGSKPKSHLTAIGRD